MQKIAKKINDNMLRRIFLVFIIAFILTTTNKLSCASGQNVNNNQDKCSISCFSTSSDPRKGPQAPISLTGRAIMCVRNSLDLMFDEKKCPNQNILKGLKDNLKNAVYVTLVLYIILLGIKVTTSGEIPKKSEFFTAILKIGFVLYFIQGTGLQDIVYQGGRAAMSSLSNFLMNAGCASDDAAKCMCQYSESDYAAGYEYLAMWDFLDCRIAQYLVINGASKAIVPSIFFGVFGAIVALIFSVQIILAILFLLFGVFIISIAANLLHFFILSMIGLALMTYFGVIFVPMILFSYTKQFFDNWVKTTISFVLQPVIITAFMAFSFLVFDQVVFEDCNFTHKGIAWIVDLTGSQSPACTASLGYKLHEMFSPNFIKIVDGTFFSYAVVSNSDSILQLFSVIIKVLLFSYLFMMLATKGSSIAATITGGPQIGEFAIGVAKIFNEFMKKITKKPDKDKKEGGGEGGGKGGGISATGKAGRGGINVSGK